MNIIAKGSKRYLKLSQIPRVSNRSTTQKKRMILLRFLHCRTNGIYQYNPPLEYCLVESSDVWPHFEVEDPVKVLVHWLDYLYYLLDWHWEMVLDKQVHSEQSNERLYENYQSVINREE